MTGAKRLRVQNPSIMIAKKTLYAKLALACFALCPQAVLAQGFTSKDVLAWSVPAQDSFFQTSVTMIGIVATQTGQHNHIADCIDTWYGGGPASQPQRSARLRDVMQALPDHHPQAVILAVIEKECGEF